MGSDNVPARAQGAGSCVTKRCGGLAAERRRRQPGALPTTPCSAGRHGHVWGVGLAVLAPLPPRRVGIELFAERRANNSAVHQAQGCRAGVGGPRSHQQAEREAVSRWPGVAVQGHGHPRVWAGRTEMHSVG